ncbi:hypothetical protein ACVMFB_008440 [Bradyrhizobium sp. USDA 4522]
MFSVVLAKARTHYPSRLLLRDAGATIPLPINSVAMGPLSSQTKCNTSLRRCCHGADLQAALSGRPMRDCLPIGQWQLGPANRGSSGSLAINDLSGTEAQSGEPGRLQAELCPAPDASAALDGRTPRTGARPAPRGVATPSPRLVARAGRWPAGPRVRAQGDLPRDHRPLHLWPTQAHHGLQLAALSAARQEQARLPRQAGRQAPQASSKAVFPWQIGRSKRPTAACPDTGRPT